MRTLRRISGIKGEVMNRRIFLHTFRKRKQRFTGRVEPINAPLADIDSKVVFAGLDK
jgi:hypothetical protein